MCWLKKQMNRYMPGLLLAAVIAGIIIVGFYVSQFMQVLDHNDLHRDINGYQHAESALQKTGLQACAYDAANTSLYYSTYFRDGESLTSFVIDWNERESVWQLIGNQADWHITSVSAQDYQQIAEHFRTPASMMRPIDDVVFDAFFYEDLTSSRSDWIANREWENLPPSLGLVNLRYTTDYRFAFYDRETGLFICYDETL